MGWFDGDNKDKDRAPAPIDMPKAASTPPPAARTVAGSGSMIGERVQLSGTIVSDEDLTITGAVEGTIHARQSLLITKDAKVKAVVHGRRIQLEGTLHGDVHGSEMVVLGTTAVMVGNISTPSLQVRDGAFLKGSVQMASSEAESARGVTKASKPEPARARPVSAVGGPQQAKLPAASGGGS